MNWLSLVITLQLTLVLVLSIQPLVLVRTTTIVGIANGLEVAVTVDERGIMMKNAGPEFEGQFYEKVGSNCYRETW